MVFIFVLFFGQTRFSCQSKMIRTFCDWFYFLTRVYNVIAAWFLYILNPCFFKFEFRVLRPKPSFKPSCRLFFLKIRIRNLTSRNITKYLSYSLFYSVSVFLVPEHFLVLIEVLRPWTTEKPQTLLITEHFSHLSMCFNCERKINRKNYGEIFWPYVERSHLLYLVFFWVENLLDSIPSTVKVEETTKGISSYGLSARVYQVTVTVNQCLSRVTYFEFA